MQTQLSGLTFMPSFMPPPLRSVNDTGISPAVLQELLLKLMYFGSGGGTAVELARRAKLPFLGVTDVLLDTLRRQSLVEVRGGASTLATAYEYALTERGRARSQELAERSRYAGPAPVPLEQYLQSVKEQSVRTNHLEFEQLAQAFADMVLPATVLYQVGPAVRSGRSLFLFGGPGNGKTAMAERIANMIGDPIFVPHAIESEGEIIKLYDPLYHQALEAESGKVDERDRRWVVVKRPFVVVGGELALSALEMTYLQSGRYHESPLQMKANCGVFLIDDFGRQQASPQQILNRWIVPLEKDVDYLTLNNGQTLRIPFDVFLIFSSNLEPKDLVDEAFLRRIRYKISIPNPSRDEFRTIFQKVCAAREVPFTPEGLARFESYYDANEIPRRACHPRDLVNQLLDIAKFHRMQPALTDMLVDLTLESYFVKL